MKKFFKKEAAIGLAVLIAIIILIFGINFLKGVNLFKASNYYHTSYSNVTGLTVSAPININGFKVGQVRSMSYDYEHPGNVKVEMALDNAIKLPVGTKALLVSDVLGTASIELQLGQGDAMYKVGAEIPGDVHQGMLDALTHAVMPAASSILPKVDSLLTAVNALASDPALRVAIGRLDGITSDLRATTMNVAELSGQFKTMPLQVNSALTDLNHITGNLTTITGDVSVLSGKLRTMPVDSLMADIEATTAGLRALSTQLNDPNSSLGLLTHDPALYNNINSTICSLDSLLLDVRKNPKRYISIKLL